MNYSSLSLKELIHYGALDATTGLEKALVAMLSTMADVTAERDDLQRELNDCLDPNEVQQKINALKDAIEDFEDMLP
jgi:hypothetical protein